MGTIDDAFEEPVFFLQAQINGSNEKLDTFVDIGRGFQRANNMYSFPRFLSASVAKVRWRRPARITYSQRSGFKVLKGLRSVKAADLAHITLKDVSDRDPKEAAEYVVKSVGFGYAPLSWQYSFVGGRASPRLYAVVDGEVYVDRNKGLTTPKNGKPSSARAGFIISKLRKTMLNGNEVQIWLGPNNELRGLTDLYKEPAAEDVRPTLAGKLEMIGYGRFVPSEKQK